MDVYRHDFNLHPLYYWRTGEPENRQGMTEMRYIQGFYAYWDRLLADHPNLLIDNSASGGRRLDLETISRGIALFRTDYFWVAEADQDMTYSLASWLPISAQGVHEATDAYTFRSGLGASVALAFDFTRTRSWDGLRALLEEYRSIREYLYGDFYPLVQRHRRQEPVDGVSVRSTGPGRRSGARVPSRRRWTRYAATEAAWSRPRRGIDVTSPMAALRAP